MTSFLRFWSRRELLVFLVFIPLLLFSIFILPLDLKEKYFILHSENPSIPSIFLANYTHSDLTHLSDNLVGYYFVMFPLFAITTGKEFFRKMMLFLFILLPFILSFAYLLAFRSGSTQGFSGIVAGLYGYFLFAVYLNLKDRQRIRKIDEFFPMFLFSLNAFIVVLVHRIVFLLIIIAVVCAFLGFLARKGMRNLFRWLCKSLKEASLFGRIYGSLILCLSLFVVFQLPLLLPAEIIVDGKVINILAHYLGYVFGFFVPFFTYRLR
ncbi:MAG: hypothetical protein QXU01_04475 [Candidatus Hadarchaeales archaeon]